MAAPTSTPSIPPEAPRLRSGDLPSNEPNQQRAIATDNPEYSDLTAHELYELNASLLEDAVPKRELISKIVPIAVLRAEYENGSATFVKQIDYLLSRGFSGVRRSRGDGNCFYRSLAFAYVERLLKSSDPELDVASALSALDSALPMLEFAGFQKLVWEDFYEVLTQLVQSVAAPGPNGRTLTPRALLNAFQSPEVSNSIVVFLRLLTSAQIRSDVDSYAPFLFHPELGDPLEPREFCENFVEAVDKEADHVQITALARALKLNISVAYLDGHSPEGKVEFVPFQNVDADAIGAQPLFLLYRPGHYDILESRSEEPRE